MSFFQVVSTASKKVAKMSAGKQIVKGATAGKKISAKKSALGAKKPVAKSNKAGGKKGAAIGAKKKLVPKTNKAKSGKALKK